MATPAPRGARLHWRTALALGGPIAIQAGGSALGFLVVIVVSHRFGIEAQGRFGLLKGWSDAISVALMFGLPQALLHLSYHGEVPVARLRGYAQAYAGRLLWGAVPLAALAALSPWPWLAWVLLAAPGLVLHGLLRSLLLRESGPLAYAWVTICPALFLLAGVAVLAAWRIEAFGPALLASALLCALVVWAVAARAGIGSERAAPLIGVNAVNRHAFLQNACAAAQTALLLSLVAWSGASPTAVGQTSFALVFAQLFALAASFVAPLVYDAVAGAVAGAVESAGSRARLRRAVDGLRFVLPALLFVAVIAVPTVVSTVFTAEYVPATLACQVMAAAGTLMLASRLGATVLQAQGQFLELSRQAVVRLALSLLLTLAASLWLQLSAALCVAIALLVAEAVVGLRLWVVLHRRLATPSQA